MQMKYDLFLIFSYWKMHRRKAAAILLTYLLMMTFVIVSFGMLRTELRRIYFDNFYSSGFYDAPAYGRTGGAGAYNAAFMGMAAEDAAALASEPSVTQSGRLYTSRSCLGNEAAYYTYGAYMDGTAYELSGIKLKEGAFPERPGETAVSELALSNMGIDAGVGDTITLTEYETDSDGERHAVGARVFALTGIFRDDGTRDGWETFPSDGIYRLYEPVILLAPADMDLSGAVLDVMFRVKGGSHMASLSEQEIKEWDALYGKYMAKAENGARVGAYDSSYFTRVINLGENYGGTPKSGKSVFYRYACFAAAAVMALALACSVLTVMPGRLSSMRIMCRAGYSLRRLRRMLAAEWGLFTVAGLAAGFLSGCGIYEIFLQIQHRFFGLELCRAWEAEWGIRQVTYPPCLMAVLFTVAASAAAFFAPVVFLKRLLFHAGRMAGKKAAPVKSFSGGIGKVFGQPLLRFLQVVSLSLALVVGCAAMMFFSTDGKGAYSNPQILAQGRIFETQLGLDMRRDGIDCAVECRDRYDPYALADERDAADGLPAEEVERLSGSGFLENCFAWTPLNVYGCYVHGEEAPREFVRYRVLLGGAFESREKQAMEELGMGRYELYNVSCPLMVSDGLLRKLGADLRDMDEGKAFVLSLSGTGLFEGVDSLSLFAYACKDVFPCAISDVAALDPALSAREPLLYGLMDTLYERCKTTDSGYLTLFSWEGARKLGIGRGFSEMYLAYADGTTDRDMRRLLDGVNLTEANLDVSTFSQRQKRYDRTMAKEYSIVLTIFLMFIALAFTGYVQTMKLQLLQRERQIAMLRSIGASKRKLWAHMALLLMKAPALAFFLGGAAVFGLKRFLEWMYRYGMKYYEMASRAGDSSSAAYISAYTRYVEISGRFLTEYEMWKVPVAPLFLCLAAFLAAGVFLAACRIAWQAVSGDIV